MTTVRVRPNGTVRIPHQYGWKGTLVRGAAVFAGVGLFLNFVAYPDQDVPFFPGIVCESGGATVNAQLPPGEGGSRPAGGVKGAGYRAGEILRDLSEAPPEPERVKGALTDLAAGAGTLAGQVKRAWDGAAEPMEKVPAPSGVESVAAGGGCVPCPTGGAVPVETPARDGATVAARAALRAGWRGEDAVTAVAVAGAESGWRHDAANGSSSARGMWQTMMSYHRPKYRGGSWRDPYANARVAHIIWRDARGWAPWTVYTSGAYRTHVPAARAALLNVQRPAQATTQTVAAVALASPPYRKQLAGGFTERAKQAKAYVTKRWGISNIGGYSVRKIAGTNTWSEHAYGLAIDVMTTDRVEGDAVADYFRGPGRVLWGTNNVIWRQRIANDRTGFAWDPMSDRGSATGNHMDHVHIDFKSGAPLGSMPAAAAQQCVPSGGTLSASVGTTSSGEFALASYNILGTNHTGRASSVRRFGYAMQVIRRHRLDVIGFQEMQRDQAARFDQAAGGSFARWSPAGDTDNSIAWRRGVFTAVARTCLRVPYFDGHERCMPAVQLRHKTGAVAWFLNVHNPADTAKHRNQGRFRREAVRRELAWIGRRQGPVYFTGDMNDRGAFVRPARAAGLRVATPGDWIDHIVGTAGTSFVGTVRDDSPQVDASSDHPIMVTRVRLVRGSRA